jgi:Uma2 family endonuclease
MQLIINLPDREEVLASNRQRWEEILSDPRLADLPGRIETNAFGNILMSPPPDSPHCQRSFRIGRLLEQILGGIGFGECPISTIDGVKACDAAWFSAERYAQVRGQRAFELAPEICVEVVSPSNSAAELQHKRDLYFDAGALECWTCDQHGNMTYYDAGKSDAPQTQSKLCPNFPEFISY